MLLEFMRICNNSSYIYQLVEPFLLSQYSYFDAFWYDFSKRVTDLITLTQIQVFKFLAETVQSTLGLIGLPFRSVILSISQLKPISTSTTFLFRVLIYKPSKLFLRHSPFFTNFRPKDTVINIIKRFSREPLTETIHIINSFNGARETPIDTIPNLIDDAHMVHLPLLVSDYDAIEYSKIVFSPNSLKKMFVDYTKDDNERKKTIFSPFQIEFFANRSYLAKSPDNNTIPKISVDFVLSLFKEDQIKALESEWQASSYHFPYSNYKSKESELYSLYKSCVEMNQKIDDLNQAIGLTCQLKLMKSYKSSLERHNFLIISYFLKKFETSQNNIIKGAKYVRDELRNLLTIKGNNSYLMIPYMIHVLNQFNCNLSIWIKPEITDRYYELIENKMSTKYVESLSFVMNANYVPLLSNLVFDADLRLGDRMTLLLEYLRMSKLFLENVNWEKTASNRFEFHSFLLVASQNGLLLETILMLENLVFQNLLFTKNFDCQIREMWCVLVQSLWHTIEDDAELMKMCGSIRVR
ncbi:hypothetical protein GPJ56_009366 [Histomonas meleagridis]|uniref:uncharacterized protein n=1 Tax=Histomonas meleagridis TaxID=135588 RepID=UPI00355A854D|nr:hypothetical protein GPJ56_009366 [Histomonas meleagridis]KAH0797318.1 hypothetical protein GO595_010000 [Histomonas meleagridis]